MDISKSIPKEDLKAINKTFDNKPQGDIIRKDIKGKVVGKGKLMDSRGYVIDNFFGRKLKHNKSWIPAGGKQILVGKKGQLFDSIREDIRSKIFWQESDFE